MFTAGHFTPAARWAAAITVTASAGGEAAAPLPGSAAATEQGLRAAQHPTGFDLLDAALRTPALNHAVAERDLRVVTAVVLHEQKAELHLDGEVPR
ncbi:hypothetical protein ACFYNW_07120 [Streptomyces virginiae]|uniref:hypothetical protein n=1 Tax=Streptomyces virginiae TaxID=1961 RepID=UPI0036F16E92